MLTGSMDVLETRRAELEQERLAIQAEIAAHPTPIPACDVFFKDLLDRRSRVCEELARIGRALRRS
jgi:hypothetical protein